MIYELTSWYRSYDPYNASLTSPVSGVLFYPILYRWLKLSQIKKTMTIWLTRNNLTPDVSTAKSRSSGLTVFNIHRKSDQ